jgi:hypothetical protein
MQSSGEMSRESAKVCPLFGYLILLQAPIYDRHPEVRPLRRICAARRASKDDGPAASRPSILRGSPRSADALRSSRLRMTELKLLPRKDSGLLRGACHRAALCAGPIARNDEVQT